MDLSQIKIWQRLKANLPSDVESFLTSIAEADYGQEADEHFQALKSIHDEDKLPCPVDPWFPLEVLELSRWDLSHYTESDPEISKFLKLRVCYCTTLLLAVCADSEGGSINCCADNIAISLDVCRSLGKEWMIDLFDYLGLVHEKIKEGNDTETLLFFCLGQLVGACILGQHENAFRWRKEFLLAEKRHIKNCHTYKAEDNILAYSWGLQRPEIWAELLDVCWEHPAMEGVYPR